MRVLGGSLALLLAAGKVRGFLALLVMVGDSLESCGTSMMELQTHADRLCAVPRGFSSVENDGCGRIRIATVHSTVSNLGDAFVSSQCQLLGEYEHTLCWKMLECAGIGSMQRRKSVPQK